MPLFEFECRQCEQRYEVLVRSGERSACPACGSQQVEKLLSAPAAHVRGSLPIAGACPPSGAPPCGPGCCRLP